LPKSTLETGDHVLKAEYINPIKSCLIRDDLHESALPLKGTSLYSCSERNPMDKSKASPENKHENILFRAEKMFTIKEWYKNQNNKICAQTSLQVRSEGAGGHHPSHVKVWWGVSHQGVTPLHFCEKGVKAGAHIYQEDVLHGVLKPLNTTVFSGQKWVFQQDSAPAHKALTTEEWLRRNVPAFISTENWPSGSPVLKPLDYKLWAIWEDMAYRKCHNNLDSLKKSLTKPSAEIPLETVHTAIADGLEHLRACFEAEDSHFE